MQNTLPYTFIDFLNKAHGHGANTMLYTIATKGSRFNFQKVLGLISGSD